MKCAMTQSEPAVRSGKGIPKELRAHIDACGGGPHCACVNYARALQRSAWRLTLGGSNEVWLGHRFENGVFCYGCLVCYLASKGVSGKNASYSRMSVTTSAGLKVANLLRHQRLASHKNNVNRLSGLECVPDPHRAPSLEDYAAAWEAFQGGRVASTGVPEVGHKDSAETSLATGRSCERVATSILENSQNACEKFSTAGAIWISSVPQVSWQILPS